MFFAPASTSSTRHLHTANTELRTTPLQCVLPFRNASRSSCCFAWWLRKNPEFYVASLEAHVTVLCFHIFHSSTSRVHTSWHCYGPPHNNAQRSRQLLFFLQPRQKQQKQKQQQTTTKQQQKQQNNKKTITTTKTTTKTTTYARHSSQRDESFQLATEPGCLQTNLTFWCRNNFF